MSAFLEMEDLQEELLTSPSHTSSSSSYSSPPNLYPFSIDAELWLLAEERIQEILCTIQPAIVSEKKRKEVINYIQRLINGYYGIEFVETQKFTGKDDEYFFPVFPFGSVPLKTYLPDGDIDLTVLGHQNVEEDLARFVCKILENEDQDSVFEIKDVQYVPAQVKIVKCSVQNIPVDISFNQMAGLSALCFLEKVLHRFLDYYNTFDWDNYCISINGPVAISSLPEIVAETVENDGDELLLSPEFLKKCREIYSVPITALETTGHEFAIKHLNIVDPLKDNNNLGRSVSKGNFHRIRCALSYGAQRLGEILTLPGHCLGMGLEKFFINTLERNGKGLRPDVQVPIHAFGCGKSEAADLSGDYDSYYNGLLYGQCYHDYTLPVTAQFSPPSPPSQIPSRSAWDVLCQYVQGKGNLVYQWGTEVFVPRLPFCHPYASQVRASTFSTDEGEKSRGTGTYIPERTRPPPIEINRPVRARNPESLNHVPVSKLRRKIDKAERLPSRDNLESGCSLNVENGCSLNMENSCSLNLSLEEFPLLPVTKNLPPSAPNQQFDQSTDKSMQVDDVSSPVVTTIMFGTYEHSLKPSVLPSPPARMKVSGASTTLDTEPGRTIMGRQKQQEPSGSRDELYGIF
ncbi:ntp transf 2 domain-containing protein [Citrus sinensis]|nr:ntp transf 2 domain-containing protein [Citrus sinensis]